MSLLDKLEAATSDGQQGHATPAQIEAVRAFAQATINSYDGKPGVAAVDLATWTIQALDELEQSR